MFKSYFYLMIWLTFVLTPFGFAQGGDFHFIHLPPVPAPGKTANSNIESESDDALQPPPKWLYIWHDSVTQTPYMSTTFPPWYRNSYYPQNYPRVWVYDEYHRLLDDTGEQLSAKDETKKRQQAEVHLQQQVAYQAAKKRQAEIEAKQSRLQEFLKTWRKTGSVTEEMDNLLDELATVGEVMMAMTEEQVQTAWGKLLSQETSVVGDKVQKILRYKKGEITLLENRVQTIKQ